VTNERILKLIVEAGQGGRLDRFVAARSADLSRTTVQRLIDDGFITLNGKIHTAADKVAEGDRVEVRIPPPTPNYVMAEDIPLSIVYEDADIVVIDKPAGLVVHPAAGHANGTLVNALLMHVPDLKGVGGEIRPGIVHRLDKDTSGLIVVAKHDRALTHLQAQFKSRSVRKMYVALAEGLVKPPEGIIDAPIGRALNHRKKMAVVRSASGRAARTRYKTIETFHDPDLTLIEAYPETGRTHQIRVHMAWLGFPLVGDKMYGHKHPALEIDRHFLHAASLTFTLPLIGEERTFKSQLPDDLKQVLDNLRSRKSN
jgi:23S rRNA pseudouridine1911/1915/1917 synthase